LSPTTGRPYPLGLELGVITADALQASALDAGVGERDSVSAFVQNRPARFQTAYFRARRDWSSIDLKADTASGYALVCDVYNALLPANPAFGLDDVLHHIEQQPKAAEEKQATTG